MQFMAEHGFDFNKFIRDGIPYLTRPNEERARKNNEKNINNVGKTPPQSLSIKNEEDKVRGPFHTSICFLSRLMYE